MSWGQALGVDPAHVRELAEARSERFERFREARSRFGEPLMVARRGSTHGACSWRLAEGVVAGRRSGYVNRAVFPYGSPGQSSRAPAA